MYLGNRKGDTAKSRTTEMIADLEVSKKQAFSYNYWSLRAPVVAAGIYRYFADSIFIALRGSLEEAGFDENFLHQNVIGVAANGASARPGQVWADNKAKTRFFQSEIQLSS